MKYIITESRLVELVENFIDFYIGGGLKKQNVNPNNHFIYVNSDGDMVFETKPLGNLGDISLGIDRDFFVKIRRMFSLSQDDLFSILVKWFKDKYGVYVHRDHTYTFSKN